LKEPVEAKAICGQHVEAAAYTSAWESLEYDPNPRDLGGGRLKRPRKGR